MERDEVNVIGRMLIADGKELAAQAMATAPGRKRRELVAESAQHFLAAMGLAASLQSPFGEEADGE